MAEWVYLPYLPLLQHLVLMQHSAICTTNNLGYVIKMALLYAQDLPQATLFRFALFFHPLTRVHELFYFLSFEKLLIPIQQGLNTWSKLVFLLLCWLSLCVWAYLLVLIQLLIFLTLSMLELVMISFLVYTNFLVYDPSVYCIFFSFNLYVLLHFLSTMMVSSCANHA